MAAVEAVYRKLLLGSAGRLSGAFARLEQALTLFAITRRALVFAYRLEGMTGARPPTTLRQNFPRLDVWTA